MIQGWMALHELGSPRGNASDGGRPTHEQKSVAPGQETRPTGPVGRVPSRGATSDVVYRLALNSVAKAWAKMNRLGLK